MAQALLLGVPFCESMCLPSRAMDPVPRQHFLKTNPCQQGVWFCFQRALSENVLSSQGARVVFVVSPISSNQTDPSIDVLGTGFSRLETFAHQGLADMGHCPYGPYQAWPVWAQGQFGCVPRLITNGSANRV